MKNILLLMSVFLIMSCGSDETETGAKKSKVLSKLKNTYWEMPTYADGNIRIMNGTATASMNSSSFISNGTVALLDEDKNFTVFNVYTPEKNTVFALSLETNDTIKLSIITSSNSLEGYKAVHKVMGVTMEKMKK